MPPLDNTNKRKRSQDAPTHQGKRRFATKVEDGETVDPADQEQSIKAYIFHASKLLHKACKKSKTFEVQKLTRKLKSVREPKAGEPDQGRVKDIEAQLVVLKALSIDSIPPHLLASRLPKLPCLRTADFVPSLIQAIPPFEWTEYEGQSVEGRARNRVLANKALHEAWEEIVRAVRRRMGEEVEAAKKKDPEPTSNALEKGKGKEVETATVSVGQVGEKRLSKRAMRALKAAETKKNLPKRSMEMSAERKAALAAVGGPSGDEEDEDVMSEDEGPLLGSEDEELDDEEIARELAAMDEEAGSEGAWSGSEDSDVGSDAFDNRPTKRSRPTTSVSLPPPSTKSKTTREVAARKPVTSSAFLPSLAAGYVSYSDSDGEDAKWVKDAERSDKKGQRKNRRGQRARQALAEKKYGSAAAHVVKANGGKPVPLDKLKKHKKAVKNGSEPVQSRSTEPEKPFSPANARDGSTNPNAQPIGPRKLGGVVSTTATAPTGGAASSGEKMHPSWEAKRKAAEALKNSAAIQPQGKKITFD